MYTMPLYTSMTIQDTTRRLRPQTIADRILQYNDQDNQKAYLLGFLL